MRNFFAIFKTQVLSYFGINKMLKGGKKGKLRLAGLIAVALAIGLFLSGCVYLYSFVFSEIIPLVDIVPTFNSVSALVCFVFSFYIIGETLFGFKDYDVLCSMPIKTHVIILAKLSLLLLVNAVFSIFLVVPSIIFVGKSTPLTFGYVISSIVMAIFTPTLSLAISIIVGVIVAFISTNFKNKGTAQTIFYFLLTIGLLVASFLSANPAEILNKIAFFAPIYVKGQTSIVYMLIYLAICIISVAIIITLLCTFYKKLNTLLLSKKTTKNYVLEKANTSSLYKSLVKKEIKRLFSSPTYAVNCCMGLVFTLFLIGGLVYLSIEGLLSLITPDIVLMCAVFLPTYVVFSFTLAPTTCCSISIEGKTFWLIKTFPIDVNTYFKAKLTVNFLLNTLVAFLSTIILGIVFGLGIEYLLLLAIISFAMPTFAGTFGLLIDLRFANFKWKTEQEVVKSGQGILFCCLMAMVLSAMLGVTAYFWGLSNPLIYLILVAIFSIIINAVVLVILLEKGEKMLIKLN
ncbi:MAG: hypothetical protein IKW33_03950 [Clostridia bacterium]|nr:hypothetical protein [Clostridia bacterium]